MYRRFACGLFSPIGITKYKSDNGLITTVYFLILVLIMAIPVTIVILTADNLTYESKNAIVNAFSSDDTINYEIVNYKLIYTEDDEPVPFVKEIYGINVLFSMDGYNGTTDIFDQTIRIIFTQTSVEVYSGSLKIHNVSYDKYEEFKNFSFDFINSHRMINWDECFSIIEKEIVIYRGMWDIALVFYNFLIEAVSVLLITLFLAIITWFKLLSKVKFSTLWKLIIYAMAPYTLGKVISDMTGILLIYIIGFIVSMIYANRVGFITLLQGEKV